MGALAFLLEFVPQIPKYVEAGTALAHAVKIGIDKATQLQAEDRAASAADWDQVNQSIADKRERLHAPDA